jgi:hypothetical protein
MQTSRRDHREARRHRTTRSTIRIVSARRVDKAGREQAESARGLSAAIRGAGTSSPASTTSKVTPNRSISRNTEST